MKIKVAITVLLCAIQWNTAAGVHTVSQSGDGKFTSVQAAVDAASAFDSVLIIDGGTYEEQVTIDNTKNGLILTSNAVDNASRPVIRYCDRENVQPQSAAEAMNPATVTYTQNGALRIIAVQEVRVSNIIVDGGGRAPFAYPSIFDEGTPLFHGNAAITLCQAGYTVVCDCEIRNAWYGLYCYDLNEGGILANDGFPALDTMTIIPYSRFGRTGNHCIERNRICNNTWGIYFESLWDLGSTVRFNLFFENHHESDEKAASVAAMPGGEKQAGGAIVFRDVPYATVAIHNNTFFHNYLLFAGLENAGTQHLVFNNIFAASWRLRNSDPVFADPPEALEPYFVNRMHNCVFDTKTYDEIQFPEGANVTRLEVPFMSTDPASDDFLVPVWSDDPVTAHIRHQGWEQSGVVDGNGERADIGAVLFEPLSEVLLTVRQAVPVRRTGNKMELVVRILSEENMNDLQMKLIDMVGFPDSEGTFLKYVGIPVPDSNIHSFEGIPTATKVKPGINKMTFDFPENRTYHRAVFEMVVTGTDKKGRMVVSSPGSIQYSQISYFLEVYVTDTLGETVSEVAVGEKYLVKIKAYKSPDVELMVPLEYLNIEPGSLNSIHSPDGKEINSISGFQSGGEIPVVFHKVPLGGVEQMKAAAKYGDLALFGASADVKVYPGRPGHVVCIRDDISSSKDTFYIPVCAYDTYYNVIPEKGDWTYIAESSRPEIASIALTEEGVSPNGWGTYRVVQKSGFDGELCELRFGFSTTGMTDTLLFRAGDWMSVKTLRTSPASQSVYSCELYTLQGRLVTTFTAGETIRSVTPTTGIFRRLGRGSYILRLTDIETRRKSVSRRLLIN